MFSIKTLNSSGKPIYIEIENSRIVTSELYNPKNKKHLKATHDFSDQVVLPPLIDAHNHHEHKTPYNISGIRHPFGEQLFLSRFGWNPLWQNFSKWIEAQRIALVEYSNGQSIRQQEVNCAIFHYTSLMNIGAAVIQGIEPPDSSCPSYAGDPLRKILPEACELVWLYKPSDSSEKSAERNEQLKSCLQKRVKILHLGEGSEKDLNIQEELRRARSAAIFQQEGMVYIHGIGINSDDLITIKNHHGGIVFSPTSQVSFYGWSGMFNARRAIEMGVLVGLGTDWSVSGAFNILREMAFAQKVLIENFGYTKPEAAQLVLKMVTVNNAQLLGLKEYAGISPGMIASLTFVHKDDILSTNGALDFEKLDESKVALFMTRGEAVYGDTEIMKRFRRDVLPLDQTKACVKERVSKSIAPDPYIFSVMEGIRKFFSQLPAVVRCEE